MMKHIASEQSNSTATNVDKDMVSSNAIDVRLDRVFAISSALFEIDDDKKQHRDRTNVEVDADGYFNLDVGVYDVVMGSDVSVGESEAGWLVIRSSFNRNGVFITSGVYDTGYSGNVGGALHVTTGPVRVKQGTRIAQFVLFEAEALKTYDGDYGRATDGTTKQMELNLYKAGTCNEG